MPNWCFTDYVVEGKKKTLQKIYDAIENHPVKKGSTDSWEGNILAALNIDYSKYNYMRGFIEYVEKVKKNVLKFSAEEAWEITNFCDALEDNIPDIKVYWRAEEPSMGLYATNDKDGKYFPDRYHVSLSTKDDEEEEYFTTKEECYEWIKNKTGCSTDDDIEKFNQDSGEYDYIVVDEYKVCE